MKLTTIFISTFFAMLLIMVSSSVKQREIKSQEQSHAFLYKFDFKNRVNFPDMVDTDYIVIYKKGNTTFTQFYNQMKQDSINTHRKMSSQEHFDYRVKYKPYTLKIVNNNVTFTAKVADQYFQYEEQLDLNWKITKDSRKIGSYNCQFATVNYGGRIWNAWFTKDIPMDVGPYKFKGLPGCIVEISDTEGIFKYSLVRYVDKKVVRLEHYPSVTNKPIEKTTRKAFNKHQQAYQALGFEQRMAYLQRRKSNIGTIKMVSNNSEGVDLTNKSLDAMDERTFIEIDHIE